MLFCLAAVVLDPFIPVFGLGATALKGLVKPIFVVFLTNYLVNGNLTMAMASFLVIGNLTRASYLVNGNLTWASYLVNGNLTMAED